MADIDLQADGRWREICDRTTYYLWRGWMHDRMFSDQDNTMVEAPVAGPERLSKTDVGVTAWRKFACPRARRPTETILARRFG